MLIKSHNKAIYERIVTDKNGQLVRVLFSIVEQEGVMRGRIISITPIFSVEGNTTSSFYTAASLPGTIHYDEMETSLQNTFQKNTHSPFISSFEFFMSQPTRAPSA